MDLNNLQEVAARIQVLVGMNDMNDEEVKELEKLNSQAAKLRAREEGQKALAISAAAEKENQQKALDAAVTEAVKKERAQWEAANRRLPYGEAPYQTQFSDTAKYDNLSASELALVLDLQKDLQRQGVKYTSGEPIAPTAGALKAMSMRVAELKEDHFKTGNPNQKPDEAIKSLNYVRNAFKLGTATNIDPTPEAVSAAIKAATDPMYSGGSGIGSDWVGTAYAAELWLKIRAATQVVSNLPQETIPDGYSNKTWPLESTDMTWYKVPEATASDSTLKVPAATVTASQIATANKNITIGKLGARGIYTGELDEDSLIRFGPALRTQLEKSGSEMLESLVIDGDVETSASKNINAIDTTPTSTNYYLTFDGFRKLALVTNTANSRSAGGSLTVDDFLRTLQLMGTAGIAGSDPSKCAFIVDGNVYFTMALLPELKTKDVFNFATIEEGFVKSIWRTPVIGSWQMHAASAKRMANSAGKIDADTDSNNTLGAVVAVRWDQWKFVNKRRMTMETTRIANADAWEIVALTRVGLGYRDNEASAALYNIGL